MTEEVPGYFATVRRSLTEPILMAGVPPKAAVGFGTVGSLCIAWHIWAALPLVLLAYVVAVFVCRRDPYILDIALQNRGQKNRYLP